MDDAESAAESGLSMMRKIDSIKKYGIDFKLPFPIEPVPMRSELIFFITFYEWKSSPVCLLQIMISIPLLQIT